MPLDQPASPIEKAAHDLRMSLGDHLEELRTIVIRALIGFLVALVLAFVFGFQLIGLLARPVLEVLTALDYPTTTITTDATAGFMSVYVKVSLIAALILAAPWIVYQLWTFVASGLYEHEKKAVRIIVPFSVVMAALGVLFTYFLLLPASLVFFFGWATWYPETTTVEPGWVVRMLTPAYSQVESSPDTSTTPPSAQDAVTPAPPTQPLQLPILDAPPDPLVDGMTWIDASRHHNVAVVDGKPRVLMLNANRLVTPYPDIAKQINLAALMMLGNVVAFQLPVVMLILGRTGLIEPARVRALRKYAFFASFAAAAILTPSDIISMLILALPLYALFEFGLLLMNFADPYKSDPGLDD
ncbi:MAG: twin-arginine translocase subunit TatC [Planctomycetota bacterium]